MAKIKCFDGDEVIGMVENVRNLDFLDGCSWSYENLGYHLGIGQLEDGRFYVVKSSYCESEVATASIISARHAKDLVIEKNPHIYEDIFNEPALKF